MAQPDGAPVAGAPAAAVSVALQVVEPWSNTQLCPPTAATGNPAMPPPFNAMVLGPTVELLFSKLELSGTKTDPAVPVNMDGDMFASDGATVLSVEYTNPWFPAGKVVPSEQMAHAKFCVRKVLATSMPIKGADVFAQLRVASATAELKLHAELCQSDQSICIFAGSADQADLY